MRRLSLLVALAAASCQPCPTPPPAARAAAAPSLAAPAPALPSLRRFDPATSTAPARRNLFAYGESAAQRAVRRSLPRTEPRAAVTAVQVVAAPTTVEPPREAPFAYRYLGNFGPDRGRIAVFKRDGDVVNARVGETLGQHKLQRIGVESADLTAPGRAGVVTAAIVPKP